MRTREAQFEEDILQLKRQATGAARSNIQENIDLMRLQREVKDKSTKLEALQAQFESLNTVCNSQLMKIFTISRVYDVPAIDMQHWVRCAIDLVNNIHVS